MKKTFTTLVVASFLVFYACDNKKEMLNETATTTVNHAPNTVLDSDETSVDANGLPTNSKEFINQHFAETSVGQITKEKNTFGGDEYKVYLSDGTKIEFDSNGEWKEVENKAGKSIAMGFAPASIIKYLNTNFPEMAVKSIQRDRKGIEVKLLQNDLELKFDLNGNFLKID
ncbi:PepSY-like domain-containing protein [Vaginella massiliensis]|uniref:PepSY-like domain-containing protein n=1 Tax=Vaginella massiliensis TaxID=1816680 RepID=UPI000B9A5A8C|nr:PepSY-like domain-containing protein [Vaginella massiliensis]